VRSRPWPSVSSREIEYGVPLFLMQLAETLPLEGTVAPFASDAIGLARIIPVLGSVSRSREKPCARTKATSSSGICQAKNASSRLTCRWLTKPRALVYSPR
jgi:hypothetical protein